MDHFYTWTICCVSRFIYAHSLGAFNTCISFPSSVPSSPKSHIYSHLAVSGKLIKILSIRAPGVISPNFVPRSYTRLNSTYRPFLMSCQRRCCGVYDSECRDVRIGRYEGRNASPNSRIKANISSGVFGRGTTSDGRSRAWIPSFRSSKKIPPIPRVSPRWGM
jgi:hypothetical protein